MDSEPGELWQPYGWPDGGPGGALRLRAQAVLRAALAAGRSPYAIHPGEWDWWCFHHDPRVRPPRVMLAEAGLLVTAADGELSAFGPDAWAAVPDLVRSDPSVTSVGGVASGQDTSRLASSGLSPAGPRMTVFERSTSDRTGPDGSDDSGGPDGSDGSGGPDGSGLSVLPAGYAVRSLPAGLVDARADAARLAFGSTLDVDRHRARYRAFTTSPGYHPDHDVVALAPDGAVAAFAVVWADDALSLAQLEPVGTHPAHQRQGLGRAVVLECAARMAARGIASIRVTTWTHDTAAVSLYRASGFTATDTLTWWTRVP